MSKHTYIQWISLAVAQKVDSVEPAATFLQHRVGNAERSDLHPFPRESPNVPATPGDGMEA